MRGDSFNELSTQATKLGYLVAPFPVANSSDLIMKQASLTRTMTGLRMNEFMQKEIIDRLTFTRDYGITKSINFMVVSKDMSGQPVAIANFVYSKSSGIMYLKDFAVAGREGVEKKLVLALLATGARDYMKDYSLFPKAIVASPSVTKGEFAELNFMKDLKMKFMTLEPKAESSFASQELMPLKAQAGHPISVFPITKDHKVTDMRVIMVRNYGNEKFKMDGETFSRFLKDIKDEDDLSLLLTTFKDSRFKITLTKVDETTTLIELLKAISGDSAEMKHKN